MPFHYLLSPHIAFTRVITGTARDPFRDWIANLPLSRKQELELAFRVYTPYALFCIQNKPFLKHLEIKTCGWHKDRHSKKKFIVKCGQESRFLFHHAKVMIICHPSKGEFIIDYMYMFIHLTCIHAMLKYRSPKSLQHQTSSKKHGRWRAYSTWCPFSRRVGVSENKRGSPH
jgi:hypothetical protein